eukprot:scaffold247_cov274-Pinguiococcus_pyrenoidosus.AAC.1
MSARTQASRNQYTLSSSATTLIDATSRRWRCKGASFPGSAATPSRRAPWTKRCSKRKATGARPRKVMPLSLSVHIWAGRFSRVPRRSRERSVGSRAVSASISAKSPALGTVRSGTKRPKPFQA